ncbi:NSE4 domain-containing protein, putative [Plasmodium vivax]|nr:NSE4 domain-containing protein, putative [Plasmodium vivax]
MSDGEASAGKAEGPGKIDEQYIQSEIDKLNIEELVQPEQNNALKRVIKTDRKIVTHLDSRISALHKSCQYGRQVSKIINFKAEGLSSISLKEKLRLVLDTLSGEFSEETPTGGGEAVNAVNAANAVNAVNAVNAANAANAANASDVGEDPPGEPPPRGRAKRLSFTKLSKHFGVDTLPFCPINYHTIPLNLFLDNENAFSLHRKEQTKKHSRTKQTLGNTTYRKLKEFSHESEPEIKLETYEQSMRLKDKLGQLEKKKKNIPFLNFIVDCNPTNGFNETTFRLFLVTLLVSKGHVEFYRDANKVLCVRTSDLFRHTEQGGSGGDGSGEDGGVGNGSAGDGSGGGGYSARRTGETLPPRKNQALLTAWSYQKWEELVNRLAPHR